MDCKFFIASEKDERLGERVVMVIESDSNDLDPSVFDVLDKYEKPKHIYAVKKFDLNQEKIQRKKILSRLGIN